VLQKKKKKSSKNQSKTTGARHSFFCIKVHHRGGKFGAGSCLMGERIFEGGRGPARGRKRRWGKAQKDGDHITKQSIKLPRGSILRRRHLKNRIINAEPYGGAGVAGLCSKLDSGGSIERKRKLESRECAQRKEGKLSRGGRG